MSNEWQTLYTEEVAGYGQAGIHIRAVYFRGPDGPDPGRNDDSVGCPDAGRDAVTVTVSVYQ